MIADQLTRSHAVLRDEQLDHFRAVGHLVVPDCVPAPFLAGVQAFLEDLVARRIDQWRRASLIDGDFADLGFGRRYHAAWCSAGRPTDATAPFDERFSPAALARSVRTGWLAGLAAAVMGVGGAAEIDSCFYRAKFPHDDTTNLPWHQDVQCLKPISGDGFVTAWIPLVDVSPANSCLEVSPAGADQAMFEPTWSPMSGYVCMREVDAIQLPDPHPVPMRRGDLLLFSPYLPHRSITNTSDHIRWSIDLRFAPCQQ